ncbi:MAG: peptidoglycan-binding protein, partial [Cellulosilyticaceae bacterium]
MYKRFYPPILSRQTTGSLVIDLKTDSTLLPLAPISNALVKIKQLMPSGATKTIAEFTTDASGQTPPLELVTPPVELSLEPQREIKPFSSYFVEVNSNKSIPVLVQGVQVFPDILSIQPINLLPTAELTDTGLLSRQTSIDIEIGLPTLFGDFPPSIPQAELKDVNAPGFITLDSVIVPEYVIVHDGSPNSTSAPNYTVPFKDYIKNVASSEIYPTWPEQTILANTRAIISFTLNRVFTEWYRNQGKNFTITSSTAFDHAFFYGRNIFDT